MSVPIRHPRTLYSLWLVLALLLLAPAAWSEDPAPARYHELRNGQGITLPGTTISLASAEQGEVLSAEVSSILPFSFDTVAPALASAENWCRFMPLHFNIKACTFETQDNEEIITLYSGRKYYQPPEASVAMAYRFETVQRTDMQLALRLGAERGPANTRDYRITVEALRVEEGTLLQIHSSYRQSGLSRFLTNTYLSTLGRNKVGFSHIEQGGQTHLVQGIRGVIERNVMRYFIAIDTFLRTRTLPESSRHEAALASWFRQNDAYPQQLHEMAESKYMESKRKEWRNQQRLQQALNEKIKLVEAP